MRHKLKSTFHGGFPMNGKLAVCALAGCRTTKKQTLAQGGGRICRPGVGCRARKVVTA